MNATIKLLKQINQNLTKFNDLSSQEYSLLQKGQTGNSKNFYRNRQCLLETINCCNQNLQKIKLSQDFSSKQKKVIENLFQEKQKITLMIVQKDILIHSFLNEHQYNIVKDRIA